MGVNKRLSVLSGTIFAERNEKELKFIKVYDSYRPNYFKTAITPKFYSPHEIQIHETDEETIREIEEKIKLAKDIGPKFKRKWPETTNQMYGWWTEPLVKTDKNDSRFHFPRLENDITKFGLKVLQCKKMRK